MGWDKRLGWDGKGYFLTQATSPPSRSLQHPNVLQCLGVCVETLPFLLIMEFCQLVRVLGWGGEGRGGAGPGGGPGHFLGILGNNIIIIIATPVTCANLSVEEHSLPRGRALN